MVEADRPQMTIKYCACALHAGHLRLQTLTLNIEQLLLFYCISGFTIVPQCYVVRTMPDLYNLKIFFTLKFGHGYILK